MSPSRVLVGGLLIVMGEALGANGLEPVTINATSTVGVNPRRNLSPVHGTRSVIVINPSALRRQRGLERGVGEGESARRASFGQLQ